MRSERAYLTAACLISIALSFCGCGSANDLFHAWTGQTVAPHDAVFTEDLGEEGPLGPDRLEETLTRDLDLGPKGEVLVEDREEEALDATEDHAPPETLCKPCSQDEECHGGHCVYAGLSIPICGLDCGPGDECPPGLTCLLVDTVLREETKQCLPSDRCPCTPELDGATAPCAVENAIGTCHGLEQCKGGQWLLCDAKTPSAEVCNLEDDDCDGLTDEGLFFVDWDGQLRALGEPCGTGLCAGGIVECNPEDQSPRCSTGALAKPLEECGNGIDDNCNGYVDDSLHDGCVDTDGDGVADWLEDKYCGPLAKYHAEIFPDYDPSAHPEVPQGVQHLEPEPCCCTYDGTGLCPEACDLNCDGLCEPCAAKDEDCDGFSAVEDCNDHDKTVHPGAPERCGDGIDQDCKDGDLPCSVGSDEDGDGFLAGLGDCDDKDYRVHPFAPELCNGRDDDCDGLIDEGNPEALDVACGSDVGECKKGTLVCTHDPLGSAAVQCLGGVKPVAEICDNLDNDCDGVTDEEDAQGCLTYYKDADNDGYGLEGDSTCLCGPNGSYTALQAGDCNDSDSSINPDSGEKCNGKDDDCDGQTDEDWPGRGQACSVGVGECTRTGQWQCSVDGSGLECSATPGNPATEMCNGKDDDCDGETDEDWPNKDQACLVGVGECTRTGQLQCRADGSGLECSATPGNPVSEKCNGKDDDCDGATDEEEGAEGCQTYYKDADNDGYGLTSDSKCLCGPSGSYKATQSGDCNDSDASVHPGATEVCGNGKDDNCNGSQNDEGASGCLVFFLDNDQDGWGVAEETKCLCFGENKYTASQIGDCDDSNASIHPGAEAICAVDADCDGELKDVGEECDDGNAEIWDGCSDCDVMEFEVGISISEHQLVPSTTSVATLSTGRFVVVWDCGGEERDLPGIFGQLYTADGNKDGGQFAVDTYTTSSQTKPSVAGLSSGGFVVVWVSAGQDGDGDGIFAQRYKADGTKDGGEFQVNTYTTSWQGDPSVAGLSSGGFVVVWQSRGQDGSDTGIFAQRYKADGTKDGGEFQVNTYTTSSQRDPSVVGLSNGGFVVVWDSNGQDGDGFGIFAQRYKADGSKDGGEFQVNTYTTYHQYDPSVASLLSGGFVVVWTSDKSQFGPNDVFAQRYRPDGTKDGGEFRVNAYTPSFQEKPSVAGLSSGGFVVVWASHITLFEGPCLLTGMDGYCIFAKRYNADGTPIYP